jgi:hypothetical protein
MGSTLGVTGAATLSSSLEVDGDLNHDGTNVGFYSQTPVARPSAITQTYSTTGTVSANPTAVVFTDNSGGSASQTLAAITGGGAGCEDATKNAIASLADEVNKLIADLDSAKKLLNYVIDQFQANGLLR